MEQKDLSRRNVLKSTALGTTAGFLTSITAYAKSSPTPPEIEGPFYPVVQQKDKDFDLTRIIGHKEPAKGQTVHISGRVLDTDGNPIENVSVELWQANAAGRYAHPRDTSKAPLDPHFQGWAIVPSGKDGTFTFKTVKPGTYQAAQDWTRPPHIHFKATKFGYQPITTQMYFPAEPLNKIDALLQRKNKSEQALMIATAVKDKPHHYQYDLILAKAGTPKAPQQE